MIEIVIDGDLAKISFPYNNELINIIRQLPSRKWIDAEKKWELSIKYLGRFINATSQQITINGKKEKSVVSKNYSLDSFKTVPYQHQVEGIEYGMKHENFILGDDQGLGKSWQIINLALLRKKNCGIKHCLIICGVNMLKWNWEEEIATHSDEQARILGLRINRKGKRVIKTSNDIIFDLRQLKKEWFFLITNAESLRNAKILAEIREYIEKGTIEMIAVDEVDKFKNPASQQTKALLKLTKAQIKIPMSGTIVVNSPLDVYVPLKFIGAETHSFYAFKNHYCVMGGFGNYQIVGYKNLQEMQMLVQENLLRRLKKDCLDLPEKTPIVEYIEMSEEQGSIYSAVKEEILAQIDQIRISDNPLAKLIRLRQATGYPGILSSATTVSAKFDRALEIIEETVKMGGKVVVVSSWTAITDPFLQLVEKYNPATITGKIKDEDRSSEKNKFMEDSTCKVLVGTMKAMGAGLTLTSAETMIFLDSPWNRATKDQVTDRIHRIGTTGTVRIITLVVQDTIDERIEEIVYSKGQMSDAIVDCKGNLSRIEMLDFLLS